MKKVSATHEKLFTREKPNNKKTRGISIAAEERWLHEKLLLIGKRGKMKATWYEVFRIFFLYR